MKGFVSYRATSVVGWISLMLIIASAFNPYGLPWPVLAWASLAVAALGFLSVRSSPSMSPVIQAAESGRSSGIRPGETRTR